MRTTQLPFSVSSHKTGTTQCWLIPNVSFSYGTTSPGLLLFPEKRQVLVNSNYWQAGTFLLPAQRCQWGAEASSAALVQSRADNLTLKTRLLRSRQCEIEISALCVNSPINGFPFHFRSLCNSYVQVVSAANPLQPRMKSGHEVS